MLQGAPPPSTPRSTGRQPVTPAPPVVGMAPAPTGNRYWIGDATGQVFAEGVPSDGTMTGKPLNQRMVGFAVS